MPLYSDSPELELQGKEVVLAHGVRSRVNDRYRPGPGGTIMLPSVMHDSEGPDESGLQASGFDPRIPGQVADGDAELMGTKPKPVVPSPAIAPRPVGKSATSSPATATVPVAFIVPGLGKVHYGFAEVVYDAEHHMLVLISPDGDTPPDFDPGAKLRLAVGGKELDVEYFQWQYASQGRVHTLLAVKEEVTP